MDDSSSSVQHAVACTCCLSCVQDFVGYIPNPHYSTAKAAGCLTSLTWLPLLLLL
jgi:hypothetical protein